MFFVFYRETLPKVKNISKQTRAVHKKLALLANKLKQTTNSWANTLTPIK